jgi:hypothetical protein
MVAAEYGAGAYANDLDQHPDKECKGHKDGQWAFALLLVAPYDEQEGEEYGKPGSLLKQWCILSPVYADESAYMKQDDDPRAYDMPM